MVGTPSSKFLFPLNVLSSFRACLARQSRYQTSARTTKKSHHSKIYGYCRANSTVFTGACGHPFSSGNLQQAVLNAEYTGQDNEGRWILPLLHPRWCPAFLQRRRDILFANYLDRLCRVDIPGRDADTIRIESSYLRGVRDGRICALSISLTDFQPSLTQDSEAMDEIMGSMSVVLEAVDNLADLLAQQDIVADEMAADLEQFLREEKAYADAFEEGMTGQLTVESSAMFAEMDDRDEMFAAALV